MSSYSEVLVALRMRPNDLERICKNMVIHDIRLVSNSGGHPSFIKKCVRSLDDLDYVIKLYPTATNIVRLKFKHEPRSEYYLHNSLIYNYSDVLEYYWTDPHKYIADYLNKVGKHIECSCWNELNVKAIAMLDPNLTTVELNYSTSYAKRKKDGTGFYIKYKYNRFDPKDIVKLHRLGHNIKLKSLYNWHDIYFITPDMLDALISIGLEPKYTEINMV